MRELIVLSIGRNSLYNLIGAVIPLLIAIATIPLYLGLVGTERYGALAIAWLILGYFGMFDLGLGRATAQRIAALHESSPARRARVFWTAALVNIGIGIAGGGLLYISALYFFTNHFQAEPALIAEMLEALPYLALSVPVATLTGVCAGALQGHEKFLDLNIATVLGTSLFQMLPLAVAAFYGPLLKWLIIAAVVARLLGFLFFINRVHRHILAGHSAQFDRDEWLALLKFGGWVSLTALAGPLIIIADRLIIGALIGAAAVAIYAIAFDIARRLSLIPNALAQAVFPRLAKADGPERSGMMKRALTTLDMLMTAPVVLAMFVIGPFLEFWLRANIGGPASPVGQILLIAYWANAFAIIPFVRLQAEGRPDVVSKIVLVLAPVHIGALFWAVSHYGVVAAAVVVAIKNVIELLVLLYFANGRFTIPRSFALNILWLFAAFFMANQFTIFSVVGVIAMVALACVATASSWMLMTREERRSFLEFARDALRRAARKPDDA